VLALSAAFFERFFLLELRAVVFLERACTRDGQWWVAGGWRRMVADGGKQDVNMMVF